MGQRMLRCMDCGAYTLKDVCPKCQGKTATPHPPRFSPEDKYGKYRRQLKELTRREETSPEQKEE